MKIEARSKPHALLAAFLVLSMILAMAPIAFAQPLTVSLTPTSGNVGGEVTVWGTSITPGGLIQVYWDAVKPWDGKAGLLIEGYAIGTSYSFKITIPNATAGTHYVIVKDVEAGTTAYALFTVNPKIELKPTVVMAGDTVTVVGTGFAGIRSVLILFNPTETSVTGEAVGTGDGVKKVFKLSKAPVKPGSVKIYIDGSLTTDYTLDYITGSIIFDTAPGAGKAITADYTYYTAAVSVSAATDEVGFFTAQFKVPSVPASPPPYTVVALDDKGNQATASLTVVTTMITLTPSKGYVGTTVTVAGRGFTSGRVIDLRWYLTAADYITVATVTVLPDGTFTATFTVPSVKDPTPPTGDTYYVRAYDRTDAAIVASAAFTVIAPPKITVSPTSGKAGVTVTVTGSWFTPNSRVTLTFDGTVLLTTPSIVYTDATGAFTATFKVPSVAEGTYTVKATDAKGLSATATFKVIVPKIEIKTRATEYIQGDAISVYAMSTEGLTGIVLTIRDPAGLVFWSYTIVGADVIVVDGVYYLKWEKSVVQLPVDAPVGTWNFTATDPTGKIVATNTFKVVARPTLATVVDVINNLSVKLDSIERAVRGLDTTLSSIGKDVGDVKANIGIITSTIADIRRDISGIKTDVAAVKSDVLAVRTDMPAVKDSVAAVSGTVSGVVLPIWIAVILSLIAAIASIASVSIIRKKIAG